MISIQKYLRDRGARPGAASSRSELLLNICLSLFESINSCVLTGDSAAASRAEVCGLAEKLRGDLQPEQADELRSSARRILSGYRETRGETASERAAEEVQQIVGALSQALSLVACGGERSISRLERIQEMLQQTAAIQDVSDLRASLSKTIGAIEEETIREKAARARDLAALQAEVSKVRGFAAGKPNRQLPGRPEGVRAISKALENVNPDETLYVVAFLFNNVKAIIQRFGPEVASARRSNNPALPRIPSPSACPVGSRYPRLPPATASPGFPPSG